MASLKALVIDDASFVRDLVKRTVRQRFPVIETTEAHNGRRAQSLLLHTTFDLVLCDWEMPEMSGLELLRWMRQQPQYQNTPFIMITSRGDKDHVIEAIREGVTEYLGKPFSPEGLSRKVAKVMGSRLREAMAGRSRSPDASVDAFRESAALLTRGGRQSGAEADPSPAADRAPASKPEPKPERSVPATGRVGPTLASIRFANGELRSVIRDVSLVEVRLVARRDQAFPGILEPAVVDMDMGEGQVARLNGYVHQLQAVDKRQDTDFVSVIIRFVDDDPQKLESLSRFVARFRAAQP